MINRQFTRDELQQAFALAFVLHPSTEVALIVLIRAMKLATLLAQTEARRQRSAEHYKSPIPPEALLQFAVFAASLRWERDQESPLPKKEPRYKPTRDDLIVRYLKHLVWNNLVKAHYGSLGIGLGCLLYDYKPKQIADFLGLSDELSIRRIKSSNKKQLMKRFNYADVLTPNGNAFRTTRANEHGRELVQKALKAFTPWHTTHIALAPEESLLERLIEDSSLTDWDFKHALLDPYCGGMAELILQHNKLYARYGEELEDPNLRLFLPEFDGSPTPPVDRFKAPRLTDNEILLLNERHKSSRSRTDDADEEVDDLLTDFYKCGVDGSIIELFDDSASSTNDRPSLELLSHGSYAKVILLQRRRFVKEEVDVMEKKHWKIMFCLAGDNNLTLEVSSYLTRIAERMLDNRINLFANTYWVDDRKPKPKISNLLLLRSFRKSRERGNSYEVCKVGVVHGVSGHGRIAVKTIHSIEQEQLKDLKPYVPKIELLISDWYDRTSARQLQEGFRHYSFRRRNAMCVKKPDARPGKASMWDECSFPIWGIQMLANPCEPRN